MLPSCVATFDRFLGMLTFVFAAVAAWAAWFPYRWALAERERRRDAERRLAALLDRLGAKDLEEWEPIRPEDEAAVDLGIQRLILVRRVNSVGEWFVRRRLGPGD